MVALSPGPPARWSRAGSEDQKDAGVFAWEDLCDVSP
jgi:hypothetical protein